ncbi:MAG: biopolymer transporter ExbD [Phycisphaerales bacterium]|nr:biopolymer transporter ExbD [Phycisphaerales bacterium]
MNFRPRGDRPRTMPIDMTAMVDVVFLLIIFFLTTTSLIEKTRIPLDLAREAGAEQRPDTLPSMVVNITAEGDLIVDGRLLEEVQVLDVVDQLVAAAGGDGSNIDLLIRADRNASLAHVNHLALALRSRGIRGWRLATETTGTRPGGGV